MSEDTPLIAPPKPDDARKSVEVVGQLASVSMPQFIPAQPGWRLAVLGPDEDLEACPIVAWEVGDDAYMTPWARLHAQDGYGVARWAMSAARVVGLLAPGEELDSGWYEAAKEVTEALRTPPVISERQSEWRWSHGFSDWAWDEETECWFHISAEPGHDYYCLGDRMFHGAYGAKRGDVVYIGSYVDNWHGGVQTADFDEALGWLYQANGTDNWHWSKV